MFVNCISRVVSFVFSLTISNTGKKYEKVYKDQKRSVITRFDSAQHNVKEFLDHLCCYDKQTKKTFRPMLCQEFTVREVCVLVFCSRTSLLFLFFREFCEFFPCLYLCSNELIS
jgi:hypothetical protein